jgi:hypothetical protein
LEAAAQGGDETGVLIGDDQLHAAEAALAERLEEAAPEHLVFAVADVDPKHLAVAGGGDPGGDHDGHRAHLAGLVADMQAGGVQVGVGELDVIQPAGAERPNNLVEPGADP